MFEGLYSAYVGEIFRFLQYRVKNKERAEDLTQDTFLKALKGIRNFDEALSFRPWIFQIARNVLVDHYRARHETVSLDDDEMPDAADPQDIERESHARHLLADVQEALDQLPGLQRDIVIMRVWDGLSHKEIAEILGKTEGNCKMIFSRAVARLKNTVPLAVFITLYIHY
jgi:RNA polymerase sigma-70 factor (ECF subfamily)